MTQHARWRRSRTAVVGAAAVAMLAAGCGSGGNGGGGGGNSGPADTLVAYTGQAGDYQRNFNPYAPTMIEGPGNIFEPLFFYNVARDGEPTPRLATEFSWNDSGTELSITTRENVTWSDGEPFTAHDVAFTFDMVRANQTMNAIGFEGETEVIDDTHLVVRYPQPAYLEAPSVLGKLWIVPEHIWGAFEDPAQNTVQEPVGTGPFVLGDFKPQAFTLSANPTYWGGEPEVKNIRFVSLSGNQAGADALAAGQIDFQTGPVPDIHNIEKNYPGYEGITAHIFQIALFTCSDTALGCSGPQTDPAVRHAIYHAIDRTQINTLAYQDTASEISPGFALPGRDDAVISDGLTDRIAPMEPDTARAEQVLTDAGWAKGGDGIYAKDGEKLSLSVRVVSGWTDVITAADTMTQQLKAAGIELTVQQSSWNEWSDARGRGDYELVFDSLYPGPAPDPYYTYNYFFHGDNTAPAGEVANPNFARYDNPEVNAALDALQQIDPEDTAARQPHFDTIQTRLEADMPYIPVLIGGTTSEYNARKFTGWPSEDDLYAFPAVWQRPDNSQIYLNLKPAGGE
ncbi:hypothetical protein SUDANB171_00436 [Streptomyces sp. enrichment culture]|jgi:peptide/nickel transport system substrate-binding protein|uniref:ABC transporter substrate-binding protein n=1 Tax=Streptomyces xiamenensis TaxID=408015 RepID=UPI0036E2DB92